MKNRAKIFTIRSETSLEGAENTEKKFPSVFSAPSSEVSERVVNKKNHISVLPFLIGICLCFAGCASNAPAPFKIGVDPNWYPLDFGEQTAYVNGFVEDMLLEMAWHGRIEWEKVPANSDSILQGLKQKKYDAVLTSLPRYTFHLARYDFSENFLNVGPVLVVAKDASYKDFKGIKEGILGIIEGQEGVVEQIERNPNVRFQAYGSIPGLLNAVVAGEVVGALIDVLPAESYVADLYAETLKILSGPLNDAGLHLVVEKGENQKLFVLFNTQLEWVKKKKLKFLSEKWGLTRGS